MRILITGGAGFSASYTVCGQRRPPEMAIAHWIRGTEARAPIAHCGDGTSRRDSCVFLEKAGCLPGFRARVPLAEGLRPTVEWRRRQNRSGTR